MFFFTRQKLDPIVKLKLKEKNDKTIPVIILLKDAPSNSFKNIITNKSGKIKYEFKFINALAATLNIMETDKLSELPEVLAIGYDRKAGICMDKVSQCIGENFMSPYNLTGKGVNVCVIDTGIYPHPDMLRPYMNILYFKDFISNGLDPYDDNGHGTFVSGVISGSGCMSDGKYKGIAPGSKIIMLKAFNNVGEGSFSDIIAAIGWAILNKEKYKIRILCLPFGADSIVPNNIDPLSLACRAASDKNIIVVAASGNKGPNSDTITTPGIEPSIITVGCCSTPDMDIKSWKVADFSSRGFRNEMAPKPELIAPGVNITSLLSDINFLPLPGRRKTPLEPSANPYIKMTGSSVSAAVAAGAISLILEKMPGISGDDLKGILKLSCQTLNDLKPSQGYGMINLKKLLNE